MIVTLAFLLAIFAGSAQASRATLTPADDTGSADSSALICLALVGGTALLAGNGVAEHAATCASPAASRMTGKPIGLALDVWQSL